MVWAELGGLRPLGQVLVVIPRLCTKFAPNNAKFRALFCARAGDLHIRLIRGLRWPSAAHTIETGHCRLQLGGSENLSPIWLGRSVTSAINIIASQREIFWRRPGVEFFNPSTQPFALVSELTASSLGSTSAAAILVNIQRQHGEDSATGDERRRSDGSTHACCSHGGAASTSRATCPEL